MAFTAEVPAKIEESASCCCRVRLDVRALWNNSLHQKLCTRFWGIHAFEEQELDDDPPFNNYGIVPPIWPGQLGVSRERAPYSTDILTFCRQFGYSPERRAVLKGLLELRKLLGRMGIGEGFQWLDGSFCEDVERLRSRPPADIDVVTFCELGDKSHQEGMIAKYPAIVDREAVISKYRVDHFIVGTDLCDDPEKAEKFINTVVYWYSMWAHQRETQRWKGFVSVPLDSNDQEALNWLNKNSPEKGAEP